LLHFGEGSRAEGRPLVEALDDILHGLPSASLKLWLCGSPKEWDLFAWSALPLLEKWGGQNRKITLVVNEVALDTAVLNATES
jgi:hypothetical protein